MTLFQRARDEGLPESPHSWKQALEAALRVSEIAASAMGLREAIGALLDVAMDLLDAEQGSVMLLGGGGGTLVLVACAGSSIDVPLGSELAVGESVAGRVIATGKPLLLDDVEADAFVNFIPKARLISSSVVVPLRAHGRPEGVLSLAIARSGRFTSDDLRVAQMFADQAGSMIYRARLHERAEQRSSDLMALVDSSRGLLGNLDPHALLYKVLDGAARLAGSTGGFACLFDAETGKMSHGVFRGIDRRLVGELVAHDAVRRALDDGDVAVFEHPELGTAVAVGLRDGSTTGVVVAPADERLIRDRGDLLRAFGQQCGSAIGAAGLHAEVERNRSALESIIQGVPNPIVLVDAHLNIAALNPAAEHLFSISSSFSAGVKVRGALNEPTVEDLFSHAGDVVTEVAVGTPPRTYKARVADVRVPGAPAGRVLVMDDITAEREMAQRQRDFVAMIGHELRTPLTIIKGFAKTLLRRVDRLKPDEAREALTTIEARANQLARLIEDLLYVARIESREATLRLDQVDVAALAQAVIEDLVAVHGDREIACDFPTSLAWTCDDTKVGVVLRHLTENALKYSDEPAPVTVRMTDAGDELRIEVVDRGVGILSTDTPHIFDRFRQVDSSSTREHGGTGVGLYVCAQLVRMHGGTIWVDSTWGKGSTFGFSLPRVAAARRIARATPPAAAVAV